MRFSGFAVFLLAAAVGLAGTASARPGALDPTFGENGIVRTTPVPGGDEAPADLAESPDGRLVVAGSASQGPGSIVVRYLPDGSLDPEFGDQGQVRSAGDGWDQVEVLGDGRVLLAGGSGSQLKFTRLLADGGPDLTFGGTGSVTLETAGLYTLPEGATADAAVSSLEVMGDGSLRAIGPFAGCGTTGFHCATALIAGVDEAGAPMAVFGPGGVKDSRVGGKGILSATLPDGNSLVIRSETGDPPYGDILYSTPVSPTGEPGEAKIISHGNNFYWSNLDWSSGGITVDSDGRVLLVDSDHLWRLGPDGDGDPGFGTEGMVELRDLTRFLPGTPGLFATGVSVDEEGRILVSGGVSSGIGKQEWGGDSWASAGVAARLNPDGSIDSSFGGGGIQVLWRGKRSTRKLVGNTRALALGQSVVVAGRGPAGEGFGFTLARAANDEMEMPQCGGRQAEYVGSPGGERIEVLDAVVATLGGDDRIQSYSGSVICSGPGDDAVTLGSGAAKVFGGSGDDRIVAGRHGSFASGGKGDDFIKGGDGSDRLFGHDGRDLILGGGRDDRMFGGSGDDRLFGQDGRDWLFGGAGRDRLSVGPVGPDLTDYRPKIPGGQMKITTRGFTANLAIRTPMTCDDGKEDFKHSFSIRGIPFDAVSGDLSRPRDKDASLSDDFVNIFDLDSKVKNGRITGRFRIIEGESYFSNYLCRSGSGPWARKSVLKDAWVEFTAKAERKPQQVARQD